MLEDLPKSGPTDPIEYYRRPLVGRLFRKRINIGLELLGDRRFRRGLEVESPGPKTWLPSLAV